MTGVHDLRQAIMLIDFCEDNLLQESIFIIQVIPGCFSYNDLKLMKFSKFEKIYKIAKDINDKRK